MMYLSVLWLIDFLSLFALFTVTTLYAIWWFSIELLSNAVIFFSINVSKWIKFHKIFYYYRHNFHLKLYDSVLKMILFNSTEHLNFISNKTRNLSIEDFNLFVITNLSLLRLLIKAIKPYNTTYYDIWLIIELTKQRMNSMLILIGI